MLVHINRVRQMASVLQSIGVASTTGNGDGCLKWSTSSLWNNSHRPDAIGDNDTSFTLDKVRSRFLQEKKRSTLGKGSENTAATSALLN